MVLRTAKAWGLTPSQFDALDADDQGEMIASETVFGLIESYHMEKVTEKNKTMDGGGMRPGEFNSKEQALRARRQQNA